jgi:hypothetical protein
MGKNKFWTSDKIVAFTALFISLLTLIIFIWQTNLMQKQNHLSVLPYLLMDSSNNGSEFTFAIDLDNHGVGPAIIENSSIHYKGKTYHMQFVDFLKEQIPDMDSVATINVTTVQNGLAIPAGGRINMLTVGGGETSYRTFLKIMTELQQDGFGYEIHYKSIYDDQWKITSLTNSPEALH